MPANCSNFCRVFSSVFRSMTFNLGIVYTLFITLLVIQPINANANARYAALIMEESSGKILYSRNADKQLYPASLTKIMTL